MPQLTKLIQCPSCKESFGYSDEFVWYNGDEQVCVTEQHPDWTHVICTTCAEEQNLI